MDIKTLLEDISNYIKQNKPETEFLAMITTLQDFCDDNDIEFTFQTEDPVDDNYYDDEDNPSDSED